MTSFISVHSNHHRVPYKAKRSICALILNVTSATFKQHLLGTQYFNLKIQNRIWLDTPCWKSTRPVCIIRGALQRFRSISKY